MRPCCSCEEGIDTFRLICIILLIPPSCVDLFDSYRCSSMPCLREKANLPLYISFLQLKTLLSFLPIHSSHFPSLGQTPRICPTFLAREDLPRLTTSLWRYSLHSYLTQNLLFSSWKETQEPPFCFSLAGSCSLSTLLNYLFLPSGGSWLRLSLNDTSNQPPQSDARGSITRVSCNHSTNSLFVRVFRTIQHPDDPFSFDIWADFQPTLYLRHHLAPREQIAACGKSLRSCLWPFKIRRGSGPLAPCNIAACITFVGHPDRPGHHRSEIHRFFLLPWGQE